MFQAARIAAHNAGLSLPIDTPLALTALFLFPRPLSPEFDVPATVKTGDLDKLVRNVFDALTPRKAPIKARVITDDARFINLEAHADYVHESESYGAFIQIFSYREPPRQALDDYRRRGAQGMTDGGVFG